MKATPPGGCSSHAQDSSPSKRQTRCHRHVNGAPFPVIGLKWDKQLHSDKPPKAASICCPACAPKHWIRAARWLAHCEMQCNTTVQTRQQSTCSVGTHSLSARLAGRLTLGASIQQVGTQLEGKKLSAVTQHMTEEAWAEEKPGNRMEGGSLEGPLSLLSGVEASGTQIHPQCTSTRSLTTPLHTMMLPMHKPQVVQHWCKYLPRPA